MIQFIFTCCSCHWVQVFHVRAVARAKKARTRRAQSTRSTKVSSLCRIYSNRFWQQNLTIWVTCQRYSWSRGSRCCWHIPQQSGSTFSFSYFSSSLPILTESALKVNAQNNKFEFTSNGSWMGYLSNFATVLQKVSFVKDQENWIKEH